MNFDVRSSTPSGNPYTQPSGKQLNCGPVCDTLKNYSDDFSGRILSVLKPVDQKVEKLNQQFEYFKDNSRVNQYGELILPDLTGELSNEDFFQLIYKLIDYFTKKEKQPITHILLPDQGDMKKAFQELLSQNYPLLSLERCIPGNMLFQSSCFGVKLINERFGKTFYDLLNSKIQAYILDAFSQDSQNDNFKPRVVRTNYKHFTLSTGKKDWDIHEKFGVKGEKIIQHILQNITDEEIIKALLQENIDISENSCKSVRSVVFNNLHVGITSHEIQGNNLEEKVFDLYQAEYNARQVVQSEEYIPFSWVKFHNRVASLLFEKGNFIKKYSKTTLHIDGYPFPVILDGNINMQVVSYMRKKAHFDDQECLQDLRNFITGLNASLDFISPYVLRAGETPEMLEKDILRISASIQDRKISVQDVFRNYKGTYTGKAIDVLTSQEKGTRIFFDVADMGTENIRAQIAALDLLKDTKDVATLTGVLSGVTQKFIGNIQDISSACPDSKIGVDGDEVNIFIQQYNPVFFNQLSQILAKSDFGIRMIVCENTDQMTFANMDTCSQMIKPVLSTLQRKTGKTNIHVTLHLKSQADIAKIKFLDYADIIIVDNNSKTQVGTVGDTPLYLEKGFTDVQYHLVY